MSRIHSLTELKQIRQKLRRNSTPAEKIFWNALRNNQWTLKFRRQHSTKNYIVDFYCPKLNLIIEIDGDTHAREDQMKKDKEKEDFFKKMKFLIIRYNNADVLKNIDGVFQDLEKKIGLIFQTSPNLPLSKGRE